ncbi:TetR/AcrR family transcriptional regulator [Gordonia sp. NB41Y]|uniref:TetR/AcrR family transcriptional regulator n=1 Tax=Gordonia sp. NB41Y TaxID=875808 RepID=UPI0003487F45|nr:TetR/AcrR family transcriptional regulator [Gordonia sp. NB41Y]EMP12481.2 TetR family transcriptional regulator [Gordonia sp. NB41Y]WLP88792.1 TetR/AcrR family transcriptional regulator [Gordonia sp. NB41Y]
MASPTPAPKTLLERAYDDVTTAAEDGAADDPTRTRLLDAAYEQFCRMGIQRSSMDEVARRAGLSRVTIYRKFASKDALVEEVMRREFGTYIARFLDDIAPGESAADRLVLGFVSSYRSISRNPLIAGLLEAEPSLVAGAVVGGDGRTMAVVRSFVAQQLRREQRAGTVRADLDTELTAEMMVRISTSLLTIPSHIVDLDDDAALADVARRYLVPMLEAEPRAPAGRVSR